MLLTYTENTHLQQFSLFWTLSMVRIFTQDAFHVKKLPEDAYFWSLKVIDVFV